MDIVLSIQETIRLLKDDKLSNFNPYGMGHYHGNYNTVYNNRSEMDSNLEQIDKLIDHLFDEVNIQLDNEVNIDVFKQILTGIKGTIINQLGKGNSRMWRQWEENASYQSVYQGGLYDYFDTYRQDQNYAKSYHKPASIQKVVTVNYRPTKVLKWELIIKEEVGTFIKKMMALNKSTEWGCAFSWLMNKKKKQIIIDRIYIMPVNQGGAHVTFVNESEFIIFQDVSELGQFVTDLGDDRFAGMMHSHHNMGSWHSSTDHGTIATYINDFKSVLSLVWAWKGKGTEITCDVILKTKKDGFLMDNIVFENEISSEDKDIEYIDSKWVDQYNEMRVIVDRDYDKYKKILDLFEKSGKFISINKLYDVVHNGDRKCHTADIIKELI